MTNMISPIFHLAKRHWYGLTNSIRVLPDFMLIGSTKSGTTSLYHYLDSHDELVAASKKYVGYFDVNYRLGLAWYRSWFQTKINKGKSLSFDATPSYFQFSWSAKRIAETLPNVKLLLVLRNPTDMSYSKYQAACKKFNLKIPFSDLIEKELNDFNEDSMMNLKNIRYNSYILPNIYVKLLKDWLKYFSLEQMLIFSTEELSRNPKQTLYKIFDFLNVAHQEIDTNYRKNSSGNYPPMEYDVRQRLDSFFKPYNEELFKLINQKFDWDK